MKSLDKCVWSPPPFFEKKNNDNFWPFNPGKYNAARKNADDLTSWIFLEVTRSNTNCSVFLRTSRSGEVSTRRMSMTSSWKKSVWSQHDIAYRTNKNKQFHKPLHESHYCILWLYFQGTMKHCVTCSTFSWAGLFLRAISRSRTINLTLLSLSLTISSM